MTVLVCAEVVELSLNSRARGHHVLSQVSTLECQNCILEKNSIFVYNGNFEVKESRMTNKLLKTQQVENMNGLSLTWTWSARRKKDQEVDRVRMVREEEFHDVAEWFVMDDTDGDDDWCIVGETDTPDVVRAVRTDEHVPEEGLQLIILDSGSDASLLPCDHPEAGKVSSGRTGILLEDAQGNQIKSAGMVTAVIDVEQGDCWTAPSISENFIVSEATNILLSMGRILKSGWRLEYDGLVKAPSESEPSVTLSLGIRDAPSGTALSRPANGEHRPGGNRGQ